MTTEPKALQPKPKAPPLSRASIIRLERARGSLAFTTRSYTRFNDRKARRDP